MKAFIPDLNGTYGPGGYHVTYYLDGDSVKRKKEIGGVDRTNILIDDVLKLEFFPESSRINILPEMDVDHDKQADISLNTEVNLRNFGL